jgi:very-short-patch-repair endonuclease
MKKARQESKKDGLVAILKNKSDLTILQEQGWYRIPVVSAPRRWPPRWLAFYQPKVFGTDAYRIRYFGQVNDIHRAKRSEIFPNEIASIYSDREYYILNLTKLEEREKPILSIHPRRLLFVPTTWAKFELAEQINDLFDDSPLEDQLWLELKQLSIEAERQWAVNLNDALYYLDFALFCKSGRIDVETDGDTWHLGRERVPLDNARDNALQIAGWTVLRFNTRQIRENLQTECLRGIEASINNLGGLSSDGLVPRIFYGKGDSSVQQLNMFDGGIQDYFLESFSESDSDD